MTDPGADPGWGFDWRILVPGLGTTAMRQTKGLAQMRALLVSFVVNLVLFGVVLAFVVSRDDPALSTSVAVLVVAALGVAMLVVGALIGRLDGSSADALAKTYRQRFFLRLATAEAVALVGWVFSFLAGSVAPYLVALPFTAVGFFRAAPTAAALRRDQDALTAQGSGVDLRAALG